VPADLEEGVVHPYGIAFVVERDVAVGVGSEGGPQQRDAMTKETPSSTPHFAVTGTQDGTTVDSAARTVLARHAIATATLRDYADRIASAYAQE
jgi:hypothetical protein